MSAGTTSYDVLIDYRLQGVEKAIAGMKGGEAAANRMAKALESVKRIALTIGASFVFGKIKHALIDSNAELDGMNRNMTTMMAVNLGVPFERAEPIAKRFVEHFQGVKGDLGEFLGIANKIGPAVLAGGGSVGQLKKLVEGVSVAGKALGGGIAAKGLLGDVGQAVSSKAGVSAESSPMLANLLGSEKAILEFNKSNAQKRVEILTRAFESPAIKESARRFGESYDGQLGSLKDTAASTFRTLGAPLFRQLTSWLKQINAWADRNSAKISAFAAEIGSALATGARWLVHGVSFLIENKGVILAIAGAFVGLKGVGGMLSGKGFTGALNMAIIGLGGLALAAKSVSDNWGTLTGWLRGDALGAEYKNTNREIGAFKDARALADAGYFFGANNYSEAEADRAAYAVQRAVGTAGRFNRAKEGAAGLVDFARKWWKGPDALVNDDGTRNKDAKDPKPTKVNVTIKRVEVVADDADRFVHSLSRVVGREISSPSQAVGMPRGNV